VSRRTKHLLDAGLNNPLWKGHNPVGPVGLKAAVEALSDIGFDRALGLEVKSDLLPLLAFADADWDMPTPGTGMYLDLRDYSQKLLSDRGLLCFEHRVPWYVAQLGADRRGPPLNTVVVLVRAGCGPQAGEDHTPPVGAAAGKFFIAVLNLRSFDWFSLYEKIYKGWFRCHTAALATKLKSSWEIQYEIYEAYKASSSASSAASKIAVRKATGSDDLAGDFLMMVSCRVWLSLVSSDVERAPLLRSPVQFD
jgi:hypothetical protein